MYRFVSRTALRRSSPGAVFMNEPRDVAFLYAELLRLLRAIHHDLPIEGRGRPSVNRMFFFFFDDPHHGLKGVVVGGGFLRNVGDRAARALNSIRSPRRRPAFLRTASGTTIGLLSRVRLMET